MKLPVNIICKDQNEALRLMIYLEKLGVLWASRDKPTALSFLLGGKLKYYLDSDKELTWETSNDASVPTVAASDFMQADGQYMVLNPTGPYPPKIKHNSYAEAKKAAEKMANRHPGHEFFVVKVLPGSVKTEIKRETTNTLENNDA